jgi:hypothetical protein
VLYIYLCYHIVMKYSRSLVMYGLSSALAGCSGDIASEKLAENPTHRPHPIISCAELKTETFTGSPSNYEDVLVDKIGLPAIYDRLGSEILRNLNNHPNPDLFHLSSNPNFTQSVLTLGGCAVIGDLAKRGSVPEDSIDIVMSDEPAVGFRSHRPGPEKWQVSGYTVIVKKPVATKV